MPFFSLLWLITAVTLALAAPHLIDGVRNLTGHPRMPVFTMPTLIVAAPLPAPPFVLPDEGPAERARAVHCLAEAVYYEAGFEPREGQAAVAQVVLNRVRDRNFPSTICGVVYQGLGRKTGCQFSFVCDGSRWRRPPEEEQWTEATAIAEHALNGYVVAAVGAATHYHTDYVKAWWGASVERVTQVGQHIFYRWPGKAGTVSALVDRYDGGEVEFWKAAFERPKPKARAKHAVRRRA